jgi:pimeloyl-ACP methyl ester carboxylesterase
MNAATPVVLLHAFPLNATMRAPQVEALCDRTILTPDFPGFGGHPPGPTELARFGQTVLEEMDDAGQRMRTEQAARTRREGVARALEAMRDRPDSTAHLREIQVPVLVLVGEEDTLTPLAESQRIAEGVRDGLLTVIPGAGHLSNLEAPERFNEVLLSFLD